MIIWSVMLYSIVMYFVVIRLVQPQQARENSSFVTALLVLSLCSAVGSFAVKNRFRTKAHEAGKPGLERAGFILALVLCEAAALFGFVIWFATASPQYYLPLLIGAAGMILHYPRRERDQSEYGNQ